MTAKSFLFAAPSNTFDFSSGAALTVRTLLSALARRGHRATALQAAIFDTPAVAAAMPATLRAGDKVVKLAHEGVVHYIVPTRSPQRGLMTSDEEERFLALFRHLLAEEPPDVLLTFGGRVLEGALRGEARGKGVRVVFLVVNAAYQRRETFANADLVITDSQATASLYKDRLGLDVRTIGKFIDVSRIKVAKRAPRYATFINPSLEKGASVFVAVARLARSTLPELRFLVVEGRATWREALQALKLDPQEFTNVDVAPAQPDMRAVYANTRVLLVPSLGYDSGPRVVPEALLNAIPVIGSRTGGIVENLAGSGWALDLPAIVRTNPTMVPPDEVVAPWLALLERLVRDEAFYALQSKKAAASAAFHDIERSVRCFLDAIEAPS